MFNRYKLVLDVEVDIEVSEHLVVELSTIVSDDGVGKPKSVDD